MRQRMTWLREMVGARTMERRQESGTALNHGRISTGVRTTRANSLFSPCPRCYSVLAPLATSPLLRPRFRYLFRHSRSSSLRAACPYSEPTGTLLAAWCLLHNRYVRRRMLYGTHGSPIHFSLPVARRVKHVDPAGLGCPFPGTVPPGIVLHARGSFLPPSASRRPRNIRYAVGGSRAQSLTLVVTDPLAGCVVRCARIQDCTEPV